MRRRQQRFTDTYAGFHPRCQCWHMQMCSQHHLHK